MSYVSNFEDCELFDYDYFVKQDWVWTIESCSLRGTGLVFGDLDRRCLRRSEHLLVSCDCITFNGGE